VRHVQLPFFLDELNSFCVLLCKSINEILAASTIQIAQPEEEKTQDIEENNVSF
jgi:hypothetical protein